MALFVIACIYTVIIILLFIFTFIPTPLQQKIRSILFWFMKKDGLLFSVAFLAAIILHHANTNAISIFNSDPFSSIAITVSIAWVVLVITSHITEYLEDQLKLTENYDQLVQQYNDNRWLKNEDKAFPVIMDADLYGKKWKITDNKESIFKLPDEIHGYEPELLAAHKKKHNYNRLAIRVYKWGWGSDTSEKVFEIETGRTTYYNSLLTNRAMDYELKNGYTVRDLLSYGPNIPDLDKSKLSNQIGVNGFLLSNDHYICLVLRGSHLAIGKRTYGTSISGDLHTRYEMDTNNEFNVTESGILKSIQKTYIEELGLRQSENETDDKILPIESIIVLAAYRDIVEGNKPQFLTYVKINKDKDTIGKEFKQRKNCNNNSRLDPDNPDGNRLIWISMEYLINNKKSIYPSKVEKKGGLFKKRTYKMVPSASGALLMFVNWAAANQSVWKTKDE